MTLSISATVPTPNASRYLQQLCKHWSHKLDVSFDTHVGTIRFPNGNVAMLTAEAETMAVLLKLPNADGRERFQEVIEEHLNRFAFREAPLAFAWSG